MENLRYFIGKICTVFTVPFNRDFKAENPEMYPQQLINYFVGEVVSVDQLGIMLSQSGSGLRTFLFMHSIVGIAQEQEMDPVPPPPEPAEPLPTPYIDADALARLSKKFGQDFGRQP